MQDYERYGFPDKISLEFDDPPDFAIICDLDESSLNSPHGLVPGDFRLWGSADYWTPLEACLLFAGVAPDNEDLYVVTRKREIDNGFETIYMRWIYDYEFSKAKKLFFLFERSKLIPKAPPIDWLNYFIEIDDKTFGTGFGFQRSSRVKEEWLEFFNVELEKSNQKESLNFDLPVIKHRREQQFEIISAVIAALEYLPLKIPDNGKAKIKKICLTLKWPRKVGHPKGYVKELFSV